MKTTPWLEAEKYRAQLAGYESRYGDAYGVFFVDGPCAAKLRVIVSSAEIGAEVGPEYLWDHVSVSLPNRCPNWIEMDFIKRMFFDDHECAIQFHPPRTQHVNIHDYCLHIWRPQNIEIPMPPQIMV